MQRSHDPMDTDLLQGRHHPTDGGSLSGASSRTGSRGGSRSGSRAGSRAGSHAGSRAGSRGGKIKAVEEGQLPAWDSRHAVVLSKDNASFHVDQREYYGEGRDSITRPHQSRPRNPNRISHLQNPLDVKSVNATRSVNEWRGVTTDGD